jgi:hypothetical protein
VLFVLIAVALMVVVALGVSMCRLAALSDRKQAGALADSLNSCYAIEREPWSTDRPSEERPFDSPGETFRAAG